MSIEKRSMYQVNSQNIANPYTENNKKEKNSLEKFIDESKENGEKKHGSITIESALSIIINQMKTDGNRERTIDDYTRYALDFKSKTNCNYVSDINLTRIYEWLGTMDVKNSTKKIRYKSLSAVLSRFYDNGWIEKRFWRSIKIRVDEDIKLPAKKEDIELLLSMLDFSNFFQLRDACAVLMIMS